jgi:hypothetical protein
LKGPSLAAAAYGNLSLRHFGDLDILMPREDIPKARKLLVSRGYHSKPQLSDSEEEAYLRSHHDYEFVRRKDGVVVELQWGITQWSFAFPLDFEDIWKRRETMCLAGVTIPTLSNEDRLLILCVHGTKHRWEQLNWICDIAEVVETDYDQMDWDRLIKRAHGQGGERMLLLGLYLAHNLLHARLDEKVLNRIENARQVRALAAYVSERVFFDASDTAPGLLDEPPFFYLAVRERLRDKLSIGWRYFPEYFRRGIVPSKKDRELLHLPPYLSFGYYAVHSCRMAWKLCQSFAGSRR